MNAVELRFLGALAESFLIVAVLGPVFIPLLHRLKFGQSIRDVGPASHQKKSGTPTMGGIMIFLGILVSVLSWCQLAPEIWEDSSRETCIWLMAETTVRMPIIRYLIKYAIIMI